MTERAEIPEGYFELDYKKHGVGGLTRHEPRWREQDKEATPAEFFAAVFFPKIEGIGDATLGDSHFRDTLAQTKDAAIMRFLDTIAPNQTWEGYEAAGWCIRKVRVIDLGDA
jgi:hypothetical protein